MDFEVNKYLPSLRKAKSLGDLKPNQYTNNNIYFWEYNQNIKHDSSSSYDHVENNSDVSSLIKNKLNVTTEFSEENIDAQVITVLEYKINRLTDLLQEQHSLLKQLKEDLSVPKDEVSSSTAFAQPPVETLELLEQFIMAMDDSETKDTNNKARSLLDAIELQHTKRLDQHIKEVLKNFLQSDELKRNVTSATVDSLKDVIGSYFSEVFPTTYLPILENSYRRLFKHVTKCIQNAFNELEHSISLLYKSVYKTSRTLRFALENHQALLENSRPKNVSRNLIKAMEEVLNKELENWRQKLQQVFAPDASESSLTNPESDSIEPSYTPPSPPQPADPERSIIDQLMKSAEIIKGIKEGDVNKCFEEALSCADLSLVMAACRAAAPARVFAEPCALRQPVLLALAQQLATDMVHDTQLKCRYLEDAIINLKPTDPTTRAHLPLVVQEVRKHLSKFLQSYPSHVASRRITLIIMAANNLIR